jgi:hypothetical protein
MSALRQSIFCLAALVLGVAARAQTPPAFPSAIPLSISRTNPLPPLPPGLSPVGVFRKLLVMSPAEREELLAARPPETRTRILAKVQEYETLDPDERELRLRATELRWYVTPMLKMPPADRAEKLAQVPAELQPSVKSRLMQWDLLPPPLKQEFLTNETTLHYFAQATMPPAADSQQEKAADRFRRFFDLTPGEKEELLGTLSAEERAQMDKTLKTFDQLPPQQRLLCVRNYAKFAGMNEAERAEFLKNADQWSKMSPEERQTWRDLVAHVPLWPPLPMPPPMPPPLPPLPPKAGFVPHIATN